MLELSRHAAGSITAHELLNLFDGHHIVVAVDGVFETRSSDSEVESFLVVTGVGEQSVDETTHEGVTTADTVDNVGDVVATRLVQFSVAVQHTAPGVVVGH